MRIRKFSSFTGGLKAHEKPFRKIFASGALRAPLADPLAGAQARPTRFCLFYGWANGTGTNEPWHRQPTDYTGYLSSCFCSPKLSA
jgi:hypothetical protein